MFQLAILIGFYSHIIFLLGTFALFNKEIILSITIFYLFLSLLVIKPHLNLFLHWIKFYRFNLKKFLATIKQNILTSFLVTLIIIQAMINLLGTLGPELAFDALWYHLTMPKIYLAAGKIFYIGGILYYSAMPQLTEMFYLASLALSNEITAKIIHFLFGILSLIALYKIGRLYLSVRGSLLATLVFSSNLVFSWMSITAYIDLARTFFETMALWAFLYFVQSKHSKWIIISAIMVGFAISTKLISLNSIIVYISLLIYLNFFAKLKKFYKTTILFVTISLITALPWFLYSYFSTGNPIFPIFASAGYNPTSSVASKSLFELLKETVYIFLFSSDPISPIYAISLPIIIMYFAKIWFKKFPKNTSLTINLLIIYILLNIPTVYLHAITSSGRYILPYLPAFSLLILLLLKNLNSKFLYNFLFIIIILISISSIAYRGVANKRFIPYLLGKITEPQFITQNMDLEVGNFYDINQYFQKIIKPEDKVLIYGVSNLYYVNFPYIHESWVKKGDKFNYILIKNTELPPKFSTWQLIYQDPLTKVRLYHLNDQ